MKRLISIAALLLLWHTALWAQGLDNLRRKMVIPSVDTLFVDSLSFIPGSVVLTDSKGYRVDSTLFHINASQARLILSPILQENDTLFIEYRVLPLLLEPHFAKRNYGLALSPDSLMNRFRTDGSWDDVDGKTHDDMIQTKGSISRGIRLGDNQGLSVNSTMNLAFNGELGSGLMLEGAISDRAIPLQPEGSTHRLEEFDHIHLRVYRNQFSLQAGDIELSTPTEGSLLTFRRNVQGLAYKDTYGNKNDTLRVTAALAVPKGRFSRNQLQAIEGNQGPYRLSGEGGEPYIIILSGSERVYVDGVLLQRGEDAHYTIDYNSAELTFTLRMPITGKSRVVVEFEYSERSYARFAAFANVDQTKGRWHWGVSLFSEQDSRNQPFDQDLTDELKQYLSTIGNDQELAFYPQVDRITFDPEQIQYEKVDTLVDGQTYPIYRYTTNSEAEVYRVYFTHVGEGKGSYIPEFGLANGRVYSWVAPIGGQPQGSYEPVRRLVTPKKSQMVETRMAYQLHEESSISAGYALSNTDLNTFSRIGNEDNLGHAFRLGVQHGFKPFKNGTQVRLGGSALKTTHGFRAIERFRPIEFERDWNIETDLLTGGDEQMLDVWSSIERQGKLFSRVEGQHFSVGQWYSGNRAALSGWNKVKRVTATWQGSMVESKDTTAQSNFYKAKMALACPVGLINFSVTGEMEHLVAKHLQSMLIQPQSAEWYQLKSSISLPDTLPIRASIEHTYREDYTPYNESMLWAHSAHQVEATFVGESKKAGSITAALGYRKLQPNENRVEPISREGPALGRLEYSNRILKGFWAVGGGYELSSGLEPGMEYYYMEVPAGQGVYTWIDYNGNGIMEPDEFEIANYSDEARFIRINFPGAKLISVHSNSLSLSSSLNPGRIIKSKNSFAKHISRLSNQTSYRARQKNRYADFERYANPLAGNVDDTLITSLSVNFRNSLAYNRSSRVFGTEYTYLKGAGKVTLANGFEHKHHETHRLSAWVGLGQYLSLRAEGEKSGSHSVSEYFHHRDFSILAEELKGSLQFMSKKQHQAEAGVKYLQSANVLGNESLGSAEYFLKGDLAFSGKGSIMTRVSFVNNTFVGNTQSSVAYEMMKGLQSGKNVTWEATLRQRISKLFELEFGYQGRYLGSGKVVHSGSMMARALF